MAEKRVHHGSGGLGHGTAGLSGRRTSGSAATVVATADRQRNRGKGMTILNVKTEKTIPLPPIPLPGNQHDSESHATVSNLRDFADRRSDFRD